MMRGHRPLILVVLLPLAALAQKRGLPLEHSEGAHSHEHEGPLGADLARGWFEAPGHSDFNRRGTAYVDMQILETPYMCHLLRTNVAALRTEEGRELEISAEIEWAFHPAHSAGGGIALCVGRSARGAEDGGLRRLCAGRALSPV